jgi:hypothetical protein
MTDKPKWRIVETIEQINNEPYYEDRIAGYLGLGCVIAVIIFILFIISSRGGQEYDYG